MKPSTYPDGGGKVLKLRIIVWIALLVVVVYGCSRTMPGLPTAGPPQTTIQIGKETYKTKLGTYCWGTKCVDTVGPVEMLETTDPIVVGRDEQVTITMDHRREPSSIHIEWYAEGEQMEVPVEGNQFKTPAEPGIYYYSIGAWWTDERDETLSRGDAFYAFKIQVE